MEVGQQFKIMFWCKNCLNTSTRPRITFDKNGICNACQWAIEKKKLMQSQPLTYRTLLATVYKMPEDIS